jgi:hypothetical protein
MFVVQRETVEELAFTAKPECRGRASDDAFTIAAVE